MLMQLQRVHRLPYFLEKYLQTGINKANIKARTENMNTGIKLALNE